MGDMAKDFDLLKRIVAPTGDRQPLPVDISRLTKIIREEIPAALEKQAPPNFPELYFDFEQIYGQFHDFLLFDKLIGKNIVALGGSFSSGKSSFLNSILGRSILPAHLDPSTSVPTYVIYGAEESAWGINEFDVKLNLTFPDIKSIAHGFGNSDIDEEVETVKSDGITLGHLLQSVFVSAPNLSYRNIAFLDTPGYSKPDSSSYSAKTDERIARAQLNSSNYILWFVPADAGVMTADDVAFLDSLDKSIPKLIIITKADKAPNTEELSEMREKVKSTLDVKGIRYDDVLLFSRRKGQEYDKEKILAYLTKLDGAKQEVDFARSFKKLFVECRKFYDETLKEKERWLSKLNRAITYKGDNEDVNECLTDVSLDVKDNIKEIKATREKLNGLQTDFFTEIKRVADCVHIKMPEPSEIKLMEGNVKNPATVLEEILKKQNRKANTELIIGKCKRYSVPWSYGMTAKNANLSSTDGLIKVAKAKLFNEHILKNINDNFLKRAYIILLMSIARIHAKSPESLLYPCTIAISCGKESSIDEYLKESMMLGDKEFCDYAKVLSTHNVRDMFILDALSMVCVHDAGDEDKFAYVARLAALIGVGEGELGELLLVVDCLLGGKDTFECNCRYIDAAQFRNLLITGNKNIFFQTATEFYVNFFKLTDFSNKMPRYISGKKIIYLRNISIRGGNPTFNFQSSGYITIENCAFGDFKYGNEKNDTGLFCISDVHFVKIARCEFFNIQVDCGTIWLFPLVENRPLARFDNVDKISFFESKLQDCFYKGQNLINHKVGTYTNDALISIMPDKSQYVEESCIYNNSAYIFKSHKYLVVKNDANTEIDCIYCRISGSSDWGNDLLKVKVSIQIKESYNIEIPTNAQSCDFKVDFRGRRDFVYWDDIKTGNISSITFITKGDGMRMEWE